MTQTRKFIQVTGILLLTVFFITSCSQSEDVVPNNNNGSMNNGQQPSGNGTGEEAPNFELTALDGSKFKLSNQSDKVVVLFFFGDTCPSCKAVGPDIQKNLYEAFSGKSDYVIVGLDAWDGNNSSVESFKSTTGISFPLLLNASAVTKSFGTAYDRLIVIDKKGAIAHKGSRAAFNDITTVVSTVNDLLDDM